MAPRACLEPSLQRTVLGEIQDGSGTSHCAPGAWHGHWRAGMWAEAVGGAGGAGYTSVSTRSRSILRMLLSTATRLVMLWTKSSGNQPVSPSRSLSP